MVEPTWIKLVATLVFVAGIVWFVRLQFKIAEPIELEADEQLPDESEYYPLGFKGIVEGKHVEVVKQKGGCDICALHYANRVKSCTQKCLASERRDNNEVIFKEVYDGMVSIR